MSKTDKWHYLVKEKQATESESYFQTKPDETLYQSGEKKKKKMFLQLNCKPSSLCSYIRPRTTIQRQLNRAGPLTNH